VQFINTAARNDILGIGHSLKPDTREVNYVECYDPESNDGRKVVFVDTPGFDSEKEESAIERKLRNWLKKV
jgi:GTPase Era involved in 16S rRNA processing